MEVVSLLLGKELAAGVDHFAVIVLSVLNVLSGTHNGNVHLTATSDNVVPVDEVDVCEQTKVKSAVLDGQGLATAEEYGTKVTVGVHGGVVAGLVDVSAVLSVDRTGMTVLMLLSEVGDHLSHNVEQVVLKILKVERIDIVRAFLDHYGAGGVMRNDGNGAVLNSRSLNDIQNLLSEARFLFDKL